VDIKNRNDKVLNIHASADINFTVSLRCAIEITQQK